MVLLLLEAAGVRYGIPASRIVEVLPAVALRPLPGTAAFVAGAFSYHGIIVPVVDLTVLLAGRPARLLLSTRIVLVNPGPRGITAAPLLGLLAERVTETITCTAGEFQAPGVPASEAPCAGGILVRPEGLIQELDVDRVLTAALRDRLFSAAAASV